MIGFTMEILAMKWREFSWYNMVKYEHLNYCAIYHANIIILEYNYYIINNIAGVRR